MIIYPAIDIYNGNVVRLRKGKFSEIVIYGTPIEVAKRWEYEGAEYLHLVDLNGARQDGNNLLKIKEILENTNMKVQVGGGIRTLDYAFELLDMGVERIILGTVAIKNLDMLKILVDKYTDRVIVGIDAKDGIVAVEGWEEISGIDSIDLISKLEDIGVKYIVYTDISKDGMLSGPNFKVYEDLAKSTAVSIIASGGITIKEDLIRLREIGVYGAIVGKALYESRINLKEVL